MSLATLEQELQARGLDPLLIASLSKADFTGAEDVPGVITRAEFLVLQARVGYERAVALVRARIDLRALELSLQGGATAAAQEAGATQATALGEALRPLYRQTLEGAHLRGARHGAQSLQEVGVQLRFNAMNPHAALYAQERTSSLITHITGDQREAVRNLVETAVALGRPPAEIARDIRQVVGLRPDQVQALWKYRERLAGRGLAGDQLENKVRRYSEALLRQRGLLIARTEVLSAANGGQLEAWKEARRQGLIGNEMGKAWSLANDELLCQYCEPLDDGPPIPLDQGFENDFGAPVQHPPLHPNCRCSLVLVRLPAQAAFPAHPAYEPFSKYSADQPRVPAGSPEGGQFAPAADSAHGFNEERALATVEALPAFPVPDHLRQYFEGKDMRMNPLPTVGAPVGELAAFTDKREVLEAAIDKLGGFRKIQALAQRQMMEADGIRSYQRYVNANQVKYYIQAMPIVLNNTVGTVLRVNGTNWIIDGNHRLAAATAGGVKSVPMLYLDADQ